MRYLEKLNTLYRERKKSVIIVGIIGILALGSILAGILLPGTSAPETPSLSDAKPTLIPVVEPTDYLVNYTPVPPTPTPTEILTKEEQIAVYGTPTPTPLPGNFYTSNGRQNDLEIRYAYQYDGDSFDELRLLNKKTIEERLIGYIYHYTPGDPAFFSNDFSQIIFTGGSQIDYNRISFYSIPQKKVVKIITLEAMKKALPQLPIDQTSLLSMLAPSPDRSKMAVSYGTTYARDRIDPTTSIIVINLKTNKMQLLPVKGLVHGWKDENTLQYDINTADPNVNNTQEVPVSGL